MSTRGIDRTGLWIILIVMLMVAAFVDPRSGQSHGRSSADSVLSGASAIEIERRLDLVVSGTSSVPAAKNP